MKIIFSTSLTAFLFFVLSTSTFAQNCKWKINEKDPISNSKHLLSKSEITLKGERPGPGLDRPQLEITIELKDSAMYLNLQCLWFQALSLERISNPTFFIRLSDGSKIEKVSTESFPLKISTINTFMCNFKWKISKDDIIRLSKNKVAGIKISFVGSEYPFIPNDKDAETLLKQFNCFATEIQ